MPWRQIQDADLAVGYEGGWCLKYVQDAYKTDHPYPTATAAWEAEPNKHYDRPPAGKTVPVYLALGSVPAGHVAISLDDGFIASSSLWGTHPRPYFHPNLDDLISQYGKYNGGATYLGWGEHVGTVRVVEWVNDTATDDQIRQAYRGILERDADEGGLAHYRNYTIDFVRNDLANSDERRQLEANKAAAIAAAETAAQEAVRAAEEAKRQAEAKAADDAARKAREEAEAAAAAAAAKRRADIEAIIAEQANANGKVAIDEETKQNVAETLKTVKSIKMMLVNFIGWVKKVLQR